MRNEITRKLSEVPGWLVAVVLCCVALAVVAAAYVALSRVGRALWRNRVRSRLARRRQLENAGQTAVQRPGLQKLVDQWAMLGGFMGMTASMWGLFHFAKDQAELPWYLQFTFVAVLDGTEFGLFLGLYLGVRVGAKKLTPAMRHAHRLAWGLALLSSAAQVAEAHTWQAKVAMGALPIVAAILIDSRLRQILADNRGDQEDEDAQPGPIRLLTMLWAKSWGWIFAQFGLDVTASSSAGARRAQVRRAAELTYQHGKARKDQVQPGRAGKKARKTAKRLGARALEARIVAGIADDDAQKLSFVRQMAWLSSDAHLADHDWTDRDGTLSLLDRLDVAETHELVSIEERTAAARAALLEIEHARKTSEAARKEADQQAVEARRRSETETAKTEAARQTLATIEDEAEQARSQALAAKERAAIAQQEAEAARDDAERAREDAAAARGEVTGLQERTEAAREELANAQEAADRAQRQRQEEGQKLAELRDRTVRVTDDQRAREGKLEDLAESIRAAEQSLTGLSLAVEQAEQQYLIKAEAVREAEERREAAAKAEVEAANEAWNILVLEREARAALAATASQVAAYVEAEDEEPVALPLPGQSLFPKSEGKERAWMEFRRHRAGHGEGEPSAASLATIGGVTESRARDWLVNFRALHPKVIAAETIKRAQDRLNRAGEHSKPSEAEHATTIGLWPQRTAERHPAEAEHAMAS
ncbi:hypothetical protein [Streptomyces sp. NPDC002276]